MLKGWLTLCFLFCIFTLICSGEILAALTLSTVAGSDVYISALFPSIWMTIFSFSLSREHCSTTMKRILDGAALI